MRGNRGVVEMEAVRFRRLRAMCRPGSVYQHLERVFSSGRGLSVATEPLHGIIGSPFNAGNLTGNYLYHRVGADHLQSTILRNSSHGCMRRANRAVKDIH